MHSSPNSLRSRNGLPPGARLLCPSRKRSNCIDKLRPVQVSSAFSSVREASRRHLIEDPPSHHLLLSTKSSNLKRATSKCSRPTAKSRLKKKTRSSKKLFIRHSSQAYNFTVNKSGQTTRWTPKAFHRNEARVLWRSKKLPL